MALPEGRCSGVEGAPARGTLPGRLMTVGTPPSASSGWCGQCLVWGEQPGSHMLSARTALTPAPQEIVDDFSESKNPRTGEKYSSAPGPPGAGETLGCSREPRSWPAAGSALGEPSSLNRMPGPLEPLPFPPELSLQGAQSTLGKHSGCPVSYLSARRGWVRYTLPMCRDRSSPCDSVSKGGRCLCRQQLIPEASSLRPQTSICSRKPER